jgi:hypothetical protein
MKRAKQPLRPLSAIESDLQSALRNDTANILHIGGLLIEAKEQIKHGEWLPWLKAHGSFSERSAQRFMVTSRYAAKFKSARLADLKLRPAALYRLAESEDLFDAKVREAVFAAAQDHWGRLAARHTFTLRLSRGPPLARTGRGKSFRCCSKRPAPAVT